MRRGADVLLAHYLKENLDILFQNHVDVGLLDL